MDLSAGLSNLSPQVLDLFDRAIHALATCKSRPTNPSNLQRQVRLNKDKVDQLVLDYQSGHSVSHLVHTYSVHRTTVLDQVQRRGITRRRNTRKLTDDDVRQAAHMYAQGASLLHVGEAFGVDVGTVSSEFTKAGIAVRPRRGWTQSSRSNL